MIGEVIVKVDCNVCHSVHKYHPPKEAKVAKVVKAAKTARPAGEAPRRVKKDPEADAAAEWDELQASFDPDRAIPYTMAATFRVRNLLSHPTFGFGLVQKVLPQNKIEVLFKDGRKLLRCG
jgi:hypothetical protein